jgi:signal transduction histidine kinase
MDRLVGDLLDAAAAAPYQVRIEIAATSLGSILSNALKAARVLGRERRIRIEAKPVGRLIVSCDRLRVRQVFSNLLSNAVRVSDDGATVRVAIRRQVNSVRVSVHHLGSTISTLSAEGTAVGFYIAKRLVEAQGGLIWLEEDTDGGAICHFTLPLAARSASAA